MSAAWTVDRSDLGVDLLEPSEQRLFVEPRFVVTLLGGMTFLSEPLLADARRPGKPDVGLQLRAPAAQLFQLNLESCGVDVGHP